MNKLIISLSILIFVFVNACTEKEMLAPFSPPASALTPSIDRGEDGTKSSLPTLMDRNKPEGEVFRFLPWEEFWLESESGMAIKIPAKAFVDARSGTPALDEVEVELIEIYQKSDMILANKPTNYQQEFLISAGEFFLGARSGNRNLKLAPGVQLEVHMPLRVDNGRYNESMKLFEGDYAIDREGNPTDRFSWNQVIADTVSLRNQSPLTYVFSLSQLGWTNCDAFVNDPRPRTDLTIEIPGNPDPNNTVVFLVARNLNSVVRIYRNIHGNFKSTPQIPIGMEMSIIVITEDQGLSYLATKELVVSDHHLESMDLELKSEMEILDALSQVNR